jgi:hypothetical protein
MPARNSDNAADHGNRVPLWYVTHMAIYTQNGQPLF